MNKYDVRFCSCGRIHFVKWEDVETAINSKKTVLLVCNNCGTSTIIGAEELHYDDGLDAMVRDMFSYEVKDEEIDMDTSNISKIVMSLGERVIMETGYEATYHGIDFIDWDTKQPENVSNKDWDKKRKTVNLKYTENCMRDDEKWNAIQGFLPFFQG